MEPFQADVEYEANAGQLTKQTHTGTSFINILLMQPSLLKDGAQSVNSLHTKRPPSDFPSLIGRKAAVQTGNTIIPSMQQYM